MNKHIHGQCGATMNTQSLTPLGDLFWDFLWDRDECERVRFLADELIEDNAIHGAAELNVDFLLQQLDKVVEPSGDKERGIG